MATPPCGLWFDRLVFFMGNCLRGASLGPDGGPGWAARSDCKVFYLICACGHRDRRLNPVGVDSHSRYEIPVWNVYRGLYSRLPALSFRNSSGRSSRSIGQPVPGSSRCRCTGGLFRRINSCTFGPNRDRMEVVHGSRSCPRSYSTFSAALYCKVGLQTQPRRPPGHATRDRDLIHAPPKPRA